MRRLLTLISTALVIGVGLLTLWGLLSGGGVVAGVTAILLQVVVLTVAVTVVIGIFNLLGVHFQRIRTRAGGWGYSIVLFLSALLVIALWALGRDDANAILLETVQVSIESALAGLLLFALVYGAYRLMRKRVTWSYVLFTFSLLVILLGALPLAQLQPLSDLRAWLLAVPVSAGARGILLGVALATVVTGVRVLLGSDRSYRE
jgi:hypothetical protein